MNYAWRYPLPRYRRILSSTVNWTKTWNLFVFKIPDNFWCRNLSNCLLKAIDKASDILMFDLPPNLQNCSLLETLYRIGLSFSLYILRFFFFYFFSFVVIVHVVVILGTCFSFTVFDTRIHTHADPQPR